MELHKLQVGGEGSTLELFKLQVGGEGSSCWGISPPATCWGDVKRPHVKIRERMATDGRATRRSKALDETILKHPLNFQIEVTCQVKVRSKVKIGAFR